MPYKVTVEPARTREEMIAGLVAGSDKTEPFYEYQNRAQELPVIMLPLAVPVYRMANYRTRTAQQAYLRREDKGVDFFRSGEENEAAQQIQHEILVKFAEEGRQGSITPIIDVLKTERQRQPILITSRGIAVNGNRRLAGMRELYNPDQFREFSHVKCMVLPATITEAEIIEIEVRLQMKQRTELEYEWINECIAIKELRDSGKPLKDLMGMMNKKKSDIEEAIDALTEADLYLSDWLGRPGDYEAIEDAKQLFYDMGENLKAKSGEAQEIARRIAWTLVDKRRGLKRRVYDFNPMFGKKAEDVASRLAERFAVDVGAEDAPGAEDAEEFDVDLGDAGPSFRPLINLFDDAGRREEVAAELIEVCEDIIQIERGKRDGQLPLTLIQQANSKLSEVDLTRAAPDSFAAIEKQLEAVEAHVTRLRAVTERQKNAAKPASS
jgi:hypothetical protein